MRRTVLSLGWQRPGGAPGVPCPPSSSFQGAPLLPSIPTEGRRVVLTSLAAWGSCSSCQSKQRKTVSRGQDKGRGCLLGGGPAGSRAPQTHSVQRQARLPHPPPTQGDCHAAAYGPVPVSAPHLRNAPALQKGRAEASPRRSSHSGTRRPGAAGRQQDQGHQTPSAADAATPQGCRRAWRPPWQAARAQALPCPSCSSLPKEEPRGCQHPPQAPPAASRRGSQGDLRREHKGQLGQDFPGAQCLRLALPPTLAQRTVGYLFIQVLLQSKVLKMGGDLFNAGPSPLAPPRPLGLLLDGLLFGLSLLALLGLLLLG